MLNKIYFCVTFQTTNIQKIANNKHPSVPSNAIKVSFSTAQKVIDQTGSAVRFLLLQIWIFFLNWEKRRIFWIENGA